MARTDTGSRVIMTPSQAIYVPEAINAADHGPPSSSKRTPMPFA